MKVFISRFCAMTILWAFATVVQASPHLKVDTTAGVDVATYGGT
jgi:hypothetical protein